MRPIAIALIFTLMIVGHGPATAAALRDGPAPSFGDKVYIKHIEFRGGDALSAAALAAVAAPYEGQWLGKADLKSLTNAVATAYRVNGYALSNAAIAPQDFRDDRLVVDLQEGYVGAVVINGDPDHAFVKHFRELMAQRPVKSDAIQRADEIMQALPSVKSREIKLRRADATATDKNAFTLQITYKEKRVSARIDATNMGVRNGEAWRTFATGQVRGVVRAGDEFTLGYLAKPAALNELKYLFGSYETPLGGSGLSLSVFGAHSNSNPISALSSRDLNGDLRKFGVGVAYPIAINDRRTLRATTQFEWINSKELESGALLYQDRLRVLRMGLAYTRRASGGFEFQSRATLSKGLGVLNANAPGDPFVSRPGAEGAFLKLSGDAYLQVEVAPRIYVNAGLAGQYADRQLLFPEEFSFGGGAFGRGYDFGEVIGDAALAGFLEATRRGGALGPFAEWEVYGFVDGGAVWNRGPGLSADGDPLYSAGGGVRLALDEHALFNYEAAKPLTDAPYTLEDGPVRHRFKITVAY